MRIEELAGAPFANQRAGEASASPRSTQRLYSPRHRRCQWVSSSPGRCHLPSILSSSLLLRTDPARANAAAGRAPYAGAEGRCGSSICREELH
jgi:hypothetical protein